MLVDGELVNEKKSGHYNIFITPNVGIILSLLRLTLVS